MPVAIAIGITFWARTDIVLERCLAGSPGSRSVSIWLRGLPVMAWSIFDGLGDLMSGFFAL
jgi:hypothetical protein